MRTKKFISKVQKIENLVQKQALLVALRELRILKSEMNSEEDIEKELKNWVQGKV